MGRIYSISAGTYKVKEENSFYNVVAKGSFRHNNIKPVVGDYVELDKDYKVITKVLSRKNYLIRPGVSNIDKLIIVDSSVEPEFSPSLILKFVTFANMNNITPYVVISKIDKCKNIENIHKFVDKFNQIGLQCYMVDSKNKIGIDEVKSLFNDGSTIAFIGTSGVGKSTLLNAIDDTYKRLEGEYSYSLKGGKHQTKEVVLLEYGNSFLMDTPGFYSLKLNITKSDLAKFYPALYENHVKCHYSDCLHISEPKCAIKEAVNNGIIPIEVYDYYLKLLKEVEEN